MPIELPEWVNRRTVEDAVRRAQQAREEGRHYRVNYALRMARARDPRFMKALEGIAEVIDATGEEQYGRTHRSMSTSFSERPMPTLVQMAREAYAAADRGAPLSPLGWVYVAAAELAHMMPV